MNDKTSRPKDQPKPKESPVNESGLRDVVKIMANTPPVSNEELVKRRKKGNN